MKFNSNYPNYKNDIFILILVLISSMSLAQSKVEQIDELLSTYESYGKFNGTVLETYFTKSSLPAAIMGSYIGNGKIDWYAFGPSIWGEKETINENNIFRMASMTKAITSVAAMQLVEKGLIGLDEPLSELMPEMDSIPIFNMEGKLIAAEHPITLRNLLTHTAGFGYTFTSPRLNEFHPENWKYQDQPRLFESGTRWFYGTNTRWVGRIVEKVSGQNLEWYFRDHITGPLDMDHTWFNVPDSLQEKIVSWGVKDSTGYKENERIPKQPVTFFAGDGGLFGSPKDYLLFLKCLMNDGKYEGGQILEPETVDLLFENQLKGGMTLDFGLPEGSVTTDNGFLDESDVFSFAFAIEENPNESIRPKGSLYWAGIFNSYYTLDRNTGVAIVYFTQFLPFNDKESYGFYRLFEREVYTSLKTK